MDAQKTWTCGKEWRPSRGKKIPQLRRGGGNVGLGIGEREGPLSQGETERTFQALEGEGDRENRPSTILRGGSNDRYPKKKERDERKDAHPTTEGRVPDAREGKFRAPPKRRAKMQTKKKKKKTVETLCVGKNAPKSTKQGNYRGKGKNRSPLPKERPWRGVQMPDYNPS